MGDPHSIAPLTKVTLKITAAPGDGGDGQSSSAPSDLTFIYGIATEGLTPFEQVLHGLKPGQRVDIAVPSLNTAPYFEHLQGPVTEAVKSPPPFDLNVEVVSVSPVSDRELVHALASRAKGAGCGGDCGCGCG